MVFGMVILVRVGRHHVRRIAGYLPWRPVHLRQHGQDRGPKGNALDGGRVNRRLLAESFARRPPMLEFEIEASLLTFR
jgi:hypothetical protein